MSGALSAAPYAALMVAPNGARRGKEDHPALPITLEEIVADAAACRRAGADALHLHVRDENGAPSLDPGRYRETISAIGAACGTAFAVQTSTETVGGFQPDDIHALLTALQPSYASVALRDLMPAPADEPAAKRLFAWAAEAGVGLQHIIYQGADIARLARLAPEGAPLSILFALGRYAEAQIAAPASLAPLLATLMASPLAPRALWMACAFGATETRCLAAAAALGGHCRAGFENNLSRGDGAIAASNAERVSDVRRAIDALTLARPTPSQLRRILGAAEP
ncbi:MAG: 3-keto-5-aminohexanoate cleavage protein [Pseudomonadota bacterium]